MWVIRILIRAIRTPITVIRALIRRGRAILPQFPHLARLAAGVGGVCGDRWGRGCRERRGLLRLLYGIGRWWWGRGLRGPSPTGRGQGSLLERLENGIHCLSKLQSIRKESYSHPVKCSQHLYQRDNFLEGNKPAWVFLVYMM